MTANICSQDDVAQDELEQREDVMLRFRPIIVAAALVAAVTTARAADMALPPAPDLEPMAQEQPVEWGSGWYLRGDIGYSHSKTPGVSFGGLNLATPTLDRNWTAGLGAGWRLNSWFRADMTFDFNNAKRGGGSAGANFACGQFGISPCRVSAASYQLSNVVGLLNGYVDLGTWAGVTPYIGAGIGFSRNRISDTWATVRDSTNTVVATASPSSASVTKLAWALMGGVGINIAHNTTLDIGYRYISYGSANSSTNSAYGGLATKDLRAQEVRVGVRYQID